MRALLLLIQAAQPASFDTTISVTAETRLEVTSSAGTVAVGVWDRHAVRIVARLHRGTAVSAVLTGAVLDVRGRTPTGGIDVADYEITVPRRMYLTLGRGDIDITVRGAEGSVHATSTAGRIVIEGGRGAVLASTFRGPIEVRGARASVKAETTMGTVLLSDIVGDVDARSNSHHVTLQNVDSRNLRASSIAGVVRFSGALHADGRYVLTSHSGSVFVKSPMPINATFDIATVAGAFSSALPHTITHRTRASIFVARFGNGGAQVTLESFTGGLVVEALQP
jgi:hypothetical protein